MLSLAMCAQAGPVRPAPRLAGREVRVLRLVLAGCSNTEVAAALGVSPDEVREHLRAAMRELGTPSVIGALITALRAGLLEADDAHRPPA